MEKGILVGDADKIWEITVSDVGGEQYYYSYFKTRKMAYAIQIGKTI